jgi:hypothetical protein
MDDRRFCTHRRTTILLRSQSQVRWLGLRIQETVVRMNRYSNAPVRSRHQNDQCCRSFVSHHGKTTRCCWHLVGTAPRRYSSFVLNRRLAFLYLTLNFTRRTPPRCPVEETSLWQTKHPERIYCLLFSFFCAKEMSSFAAICH